MIRTELTLVGMTNNKWSQAHVLIVAPVTHFNEQQGKFYAVADRALTPPELSALETALIALPDTPFMDADKTEFQLNPYKSLTPAQGKAHIGNNIGAGGVPALQVLFEDLAEAVTILIRRTDLNP